MPRGAAVSFEEARRIADAVLYEGYVLYPYRASAAKNRVRFSFGVLVPRGYGERASEAFATRTECLLEAGPDTAVTVRLRGLQVQARTPEDAGGRACEALEIDGRPFLAWDEGVERQCDVGPLPIADLLAGERWAPFVLPAGREVEELLDAHGALRGRLVRERRAVALRVRLAAEPAGPCVRLRVAVENESPWPDGAPFTREAALLSSLAGAHTLLHVTDGSFVSLLDPPPEAAEAAAACRNEGTWPVLVGPPAARDTVLSSPIVLYDHPAVAPESPGDLCDATEIDEILALRVLTLTEEEKAEARATDERARRILERTESLPPEIFERMHGTVRGLREVGELDPPPLESWEEMLNPAGCDPARDTVDVAGARLSRGSRVVLRPRRRADAMDLFLAGRAARVEAVFRDLEGGAQLAVSVEGDPAAELAGSFARHYYFHPEEVEPLDVPTSRTEGER
jgi:hypothetical protein